MTKKIDFKKKIDLLMISLEILSIYEIEKIINNNNEKTIRNTAVSNNLIKLNSNIRNYNSSKPLKLTDIIKYIRLIYRVIQINTLYKIALYMLIDYKKSNKSRLTMQYMKKFMYIYFIKNEYYNNCKSLNYLYKINIKEVINTSIINLYIINKLKNISGIYFLIKYLCL
uniref:Uncharacterized protein n=1 Tax=Dasyclonium flaccidum TaxID=2007274 RepID=A0A1Z1MLU2_9FLOR|nr:hypothetical protein [Dasyclonium flaccidum]ARW66724.1 hypothetical protein [Dasyclonium flaccidum]